MFLKQYYLGCLAHASYLIGDQTTRTAVVVDPQRDVDQYLQDAEHLGLTIRHVFLTHFHADFVAGHLELRDRTGARIHLGAQAQAEYTFVPMKDGDALEFGSVRLQVLETPGHTPEAISILLFDLPKDSRRPHAVLTGDTLFIGDVGRPDLLASMGMTADGLAAMLYDSLHQKLLALPDETLVYPAHGAGSMCGKNLSTETVSTIGVQRRYNYALQPMSKEAFIRLVTTDQPDAPPYFSYDALLNRKEHPTLEKSLRHRLLPLTAEEALKLISGNAQPLDVRDSSDFEGAHLVGAVNIGLGGSFASWAGTLLDRLTPIVIIADPGREDEVALRLGRIGFDHVAGYLKGGMQALEGRPELLRRTERLTAATLAEHLASQRSPFVLDVRTEAEWRQKHIPGSTNIPLPRLLQSLHQVPRSSEIVVHCASGYRSAVAISLLERQGFTGVADLVGGLSAWEASRLQTVGS
jgi:glyoxylase-like metal-dependent hydrolase (beta-lactamase superfamily II)/rhodanese-related sulfurtransferase